MCTVLVGNSSGETRGLAQLAWNQEGLCMSCKTWSGLSWQPVVPFRWKIIALVLRQEKRVRIRGQQMQDTLFQWDTLFQLLKAPVQAAEPAEGGRGKMLLPVPLAPETKLKHWGFGILEIWLFLFIFFFCKNLIKALMSWTNCSLGSYIVPKLCFDFR